MNSQELEVSSVVLEGCLIGCIVEGCIGGVSPGLAMLWRVSSVVLEGCLIGCIGVLAMAGASVWTAMARDDHGFVRKQYTIARTSSISKSVHDGS